MKQLRFIVCTLIVITCCADLSAQRLIKEADGYTLTLTQNHENALYDKGEPIVFSISLTKDGVPVNGESIQWKCTKDSFFPKLEGELMLKNGRATYEGKLDEPGFLQFRANFTTPQGTLLSQLVAGGIHPEEIGRSMAIPYDFWDYWNEQKRRQAEIPINLRVTPVTCEYENVEAFSVEADCLAGPFTGYICMPKGARKGSLVAMLRLEGAGVASAQLYTAAKWAAEGLLVIDFNVNGLPNGQSKEYYKELDNGAYNKYYLRGTEHRDSLFFQKMILRLMRSIDIITAQPEWDGENIIAFGRSQGGGQALIAGGLDPRVKLVCAEIPAVCDHTGPVVGRIGGWPKLIQTDDKGSPEKYMDQVEAVRYSDALNFAPFIQGKTVVTVGFIDLACPPTTVYAVYNQIKAPKTILHHKNTGHVLNPEGVQFVADAVSEFLNTLKQ